MLVSLEISKRIFSTSEALRGSNPILHGKRFFLYGFFSDLHKKEAVEKMCGSFCFEDFFKLHILKCKGHQKMGSTRISEKKVKSLLLPKDATNFSMRLAFVGMVHVSYVGTF
jgi:hypothetical protein